MSAYDHRGSSRQWIDVPRVARLTSDELNLFLLDMSFMTQAQWCSSLWGAEPAWKSVEHLQLVVTGKFCVLTSVRTQRALNCKQRYLDHDKFLIQRIEIAQR